MIKIIRKRKMAHFTVWGNLEVGINLFAFSPQRGSRYFLLMAICRWMRSHFHACIDCNGVAFSTEFTTELRIYYNGDGNCRDFGKKDTS